MGGTPQRGPNPLQTGEPLKGIPAENRGGKKQPPIFRRGGTPPPRSPEAKGPPKRFQIKGGEKGEGGIPQKENTREVAFKEPTPTPFKKERRVTKRSHWVPKRGFWPPPEKNNKPGALKNRGHPETC